MAGVNYPRTAEIVEEMTSAGFDGNIKSLYDLSKLYRKTVMEEVDSHGTDVSNSKERSEEMTRLEHRYDSIRSVHTNELIKLLVEDRLSGK